MNKKYAVLLVVMAAAIGLSAFAYAEIASQSCPEESTVVSDPDILSGPTPGAGSNCLGPLCDQSNLSCKTTKDKSGKVTGCEASGCSGSGRCSGGQTCKGECVYDAKKAMITKCECMCK